VLKTPSRQRSPQRQKEAPQLRFVLSPSTRAYLKAVSKRTGLPERLVVDGLVTEAQKLERAVKALGYEHVGEVLAVFREMRKEGR
jgi:hypothetical protein